MLTKSDYIKYLQCRKYLWLYKNRKEILPKDIDENLNRTYEAGYEVEELANRLFPGGVSVDIGLDNLEKAKYRSGQLLEKKTSVIFQATVSSNRLFCRCDIIRYDKALGVWDIVEVKSTTEVKEIHIDDLAFQKICLEEAGYPVGRISVLHINNEYIKDGDINPHELFIETDITSRVKKKLEETRSEIEIALTAMEAKVEPEVPIIGQCHNPYDCPFIPYCFKDFPEHSIYSIAGALGKKKLEALLDEGIMEVKDIPPELLTNDKLIKHHNAVKHNLVHIEKDNIQKELEAIEYPIYYLDYETFAPAIPIIDGYRPYQRIVFQYSLHIQETLNSALEHHYFLAKDLEDPTRAMSETLKERIGENGTVIAWNMSFEKGCNLEMGERAPEYSRFFEDLNQRMYDLMHVFKKGYYVHKNFHGSASLKKVLPVLVPELDYQALDISEGMTASNSWGDMVAKIMSQEEREKIYEDLLKYCELDTLAMVRILGELRKLTN